MENRSRRRAATPRTAQQISNRTDEIGFNASLLAELRAADFVARLIDQGVLNDPRYRREFLHRIGGDGKLEAFSAESKLDTSWTFLTMLRDLGRESAKAWLADLVVECDDAVAADCAEPDVAKWNR